jgi:hypothetical protein
MKSNIIKNKQPRSLFSQLNIYIAIALSAVIKACGGGALGSSGKDKNKVQNQESAKHIDKGQGATAVASPLIVNQDYNNLRLELEKPDLIESLETLKIFFDYISTDNRFAQEKDYYFNTLFEAYKDGKLGNSHRKENALYSIMQFSCPPLSSEEQDAYFKPIFTALAHGESNNNQVIDSIKALSSMKSHFKKESSEKDAYFKIAFKAAKDGEFKNEEINASIQALADLWFILKNIISEEKDTYFKTAFKAAKDGEFKNEEVNASIKALTGIKPYVKNLSSEEKDTYKKMLKVAKDGEFKNKEVTAFIKELNSMIFYLRCLSLSAADAYLKKMFKVAEDGEFKNEKVTAFIKELMSLPSLLIMSNIEKDLINKTLEAVCKDDNLAKAETATHINQITALLKEDRIEDIEAAINNFNKVSDVSDNQILDIKNNQTDHKHEKLESTKYSKNCQIIIDKTIYKTLGKGDINKILNSKLHYNTLNNNQEYAKQNLNIAVNVTIYDNCVRSASERSVHTEPFDGYLIFVNAINLGTTSTIECKKILNNSNEIDWIKYSEEYNSILLPALFYANKIAKDQGKKAVITIPGIGAGIFGARHDIKVKDELVAFIENSLAKYNFVDIEKIIIDLWDYEKLKEEKTINNVQLKVIATSKLLDKSVAEGSQLYNPGSDKILFSIVASNKGAMPGCSNFGSIGSARSTDNCMKAGGTDLYSRLISDEKIGSYNKSGKYYEAPGSNSWKSYFQQNNFQFNVLDKDIFITDPTTNNDINIVTAESILSQDN